MTVLLFKEKIYRVKGHFCNKIRLMIIYIFKNEINEDHSKRSKVDNLDSLINRMKIRHQLADLLRPRLHVSGYF